jgi:hypothetical protein
VVVQARHAGGGLRVATAIGPDVIILARRLPPELRALLRAHPVSAPARIELVPESSELQAAEPMQAAHKASFNRIWWRAA